MAFWVYILRCADNSYYTGHTDNLEKRIGEHETGAIPSCYTFKRRPLKLVFSQDCATREEALAAEQQIKGWSRKKKEAMMRGDWAEVSRLAKSHSPVRSESFDSALDRPVEGQLPLAVRPELVEEPALESVHPSTLRQAQGSGSSDKPLTVRAEPVEAPQPAVQKCPSTSSGRTDGEVPR